VDQKNHIVIAFYMDGKKPSDTSKNLEEIQVISLEN